MPRRSDCKRAHWHEEFFFTNSGSSSDKKYSPYGLKLESTYFTDNILDACFSRWKFMEQEEVKKPKLFSVVQIALFAGGQKKDAVFLGWQILCWNFKTIVRGGRVFFLGR